VTIKTAHYKKKPMAPKILTLSPLSFSFSFPFSFSPAYKKARNKRNTLHNFKILSLFFFLFPHYYKSNLMKVAPSRKHGRKARLVMLFTTPAHVKKNLSFLQWDPSFQLLYIIQCQTRILSVKQLKAVQFSRYEHTKEEETMSSHTWDFSMLSPLS